MIIIIIQLYYATVIVGRRLVEKRSSRFQNRQSISYRVRWKFEMSPTTTTTALYGCSSAPPPPPRHRRRRPAAGSRRARSGFASIRGRRSTCTCSTCRRVSCHRSAPAVRRSDGSASRWLVARRSTSARAGSGSVTCTRRHGVATCT